MHCQAMRAGLLPTLDGEILLVLLGIKDLALGLRRHQEDMSGRDEKERSNCSKDLKPCITLP